MPRQWVNGIECSTIDVTDRGLNYGDGVFETMVLRDGRLEYWSLHYDRLHEGCSRLAIFCPSESTLLDELMSCIEINDSEESVIKLIITRGSDGRGYRVSGEKQSTRVFLQSARPVYPDYNLTYGVDVCICDTRLAHQLKLAGIKHLNRLEQIIARLEWQDEYSEGLMLDNDGYVIEGTMSNVFLSYDNETLLTPELKGCGIAGIQRQIVKNKAEELNIKVTEVSIKLHELMSARSIFLTNRIIGIWPVRHIDGHLLNNHGLTKRLQVGLGMVCEEIL